MLECAYEGRMTVQEWLLDVVRQRVRQRVCGDSVK